MRLTFDELIHATERQLNAIGVQRHNNKGWLVRAERTEFSAEQIRAFNQIGALRHQKMKKAPREHAELFSENPYADSSSSPEAEINAIYLQNRSEFE